MHKLQVLVFLLATFVFGENNIPSTINTGYLKYNVKAYSDAIKELIESIRVRMCQELPELGLPQLEPFTIDLIPLNLDSELAKLEGEIKNFKVAGLSSLVVEDVGFTLAGYKFDLEFLIPEVILNGHIKVNGEVGGMIPINGPGGDFLIAIGGIKIDINGSLHFNGTAKKFTLRDFNIHLKIDSLKTNIEGLVNDNEVNQFLNDAISELGPEMVGELWEGMHENIEDMIKKEADKLLADVTLEDLLAILNGNGLPLPPVEGEGCL